MAIPDNHKWRYVFHFTDIHNLDSIVKNGLLCPNIKKERGIKHWNIANMKIQERRAKMKVTVGPGGTVHDYVPFYFSSINPMLLTLLLQKNVDQNHIVYLCLKIDRLEQEDAVFTDASANRIEQPNYYTETEDLDKLDWELIDSPKWKMGSDADKHRKMAEALVYREVSIEDIAGIVVYNEPAKKAVESVFRSNRVAPPTIMYDGDYNIRHYKFYYTKFFIEDQKKNTLVTGPMTLLNRYHELLTSIKKGRNIRTSFTYDTVGDLVKAIDEDFSVLPELNELEDILQNYPPHKDTVKEHTQKVVAGITRLSFYKHSSGESRAVLKLAAYLHDMGKGPKSNWEKGVMNRAYPDHPADAVPMLERILTEEVRDISEEEIRQISMLVIYHDLVGDCMKHDRDVEQVLHVIEDENDLEMLCAIAIADSGAINSKWAEEIISEKAQFCEAVLGRKNKEK